MITSLLIAYLVGAAAVIATVMTAIIIELKG
jgi:hypothetical protein